MVVYFLDEEGCPKARSKNSDLGIPFPDLLLLAFLDVLAVCKEFLVFYQERFAFLSR